MRCHFPTALSGAQPEPSRQRAPPNWAGNWQRSIGVRFLREQFEIGLDSGIPDLIIG